MTITNTHIAAPEAFYVMQDLVRLHARYEQTGGGPGTSAFIPGGVPHTYRNFSDEPASYLGVLSPPQDMQEFLIEAGIAPGEKFRSPEEVLSIGERFGLVTLDVVPEPRG